MPSPFVHLAAAAAFAQHAGRNDAPPRWRLLAIASLFSMFPDLDAFPGLFKGDLSAYHNQATHSLLFGLAVCIAGAFVLKPILSGWRYRRIAVLLAACYGTHLLLDWLTFGRGLKLLWPFLHDRYASPIPVFYGVRYSEGLFSFYHGITFISELAFVVIVAAGYLIYRLRSRS